VAPFQGPKKGGFALGKTKRGEGTKIVAIADRSVLPVAAGIASASPHEVTLVEETIDNGFLEHAPARLIGDPAYDTNGLDERLRVERGSELITPHLSSRSRKTEDGRPLRRYKRPWLLERLFAWLQNYPRLVACWERRAKHFLDSLRLGCICIFFRHF
jgi:hypothetical protein